VRVYVQELVMVAPRMVNVPESIKVPVIEPSPLSVKFSETCSEPASPIGMSQVAEYVQPFWVSGHALGVVPPIETPPSTVDVESVGVAIMQVAPPET
jgi:hypothetical protein